MFHRKNWIFMLVGLASVVLAIYTILVSPRRFFQCIVAPVRFFNRSDGIDQQAVLPEPHSGNQVRLLVNGDEALPVLLELINSAKESIRWQVMLFQPDEAGEELAAALAQAARRGVQVQLSFNIEQTVNGTIADGFSRAEKDRLNRQMEHMLAELHEAGVEVRANPSRIDFPLEGVSSWARAVQQEIQANTCIGMNHVDHRKLVIIDNRLAFIGGMNVGNSYLYHTAPDWDADMVEEAAQRRQQGQPEAWEKWFDAGMIVDGPVVEDMVQAFNWRWEVLGGSPIAPAPVDPIPGGVPIQFLEQRPGSRQVGARLLDLIHGAQQEIWIASPFVSYDPVLKALQDAARRGVRVVFVTPGKHQEMPISRWIFRDAADDLITSGMELYFNDLRMAHTKIMIVDNRYAVVGSFNLNYRSFEHDLEVVAVVEDETFSRQVIERIFEPYLKVGTRVREPLKPPWNPLNWLIKPFT